MSKTVDHSLIRDPDLIDVADESWAEELPVEGVSSIMNSIIASWLTEGFEVGAEAILPEGGTPLADENEDGVETSQPPEKMTWTELGLDEYR